VRLKGVITGAGCVHRVKAGGRGRVPGSLLRRGRLPVLAEVELAVLDAEDEGISFGLGEIELVAVRSAASNITYNLASPDLCGAALVSVVTTTSTRLWLPMVGRLPRLPRPAGAGVSRPVSLRHRGIQETLPD